MFYLKVNNTFNLIAYIFTFDVIVGLHNFIAKAQHHFSVIKKTNKKNIELSQST